MQTGPDKYSCGTCPQKHTQEYNADNGYACECRLGFILAGNECIDKADWDLVDGFPAPRTEVIKVTYRWVVSQIKAEPWFDVSNTAGLGIQAPDTTTMQPRPWSATAGGTVESSTLDFFTYKSAVRCNQVIMLMIVEKCKTNMEKHVGKSQI